MFQVASDDSAVESSDEEHEKTSKKKKKSSAQVVTMPMINKWCKQMKVRWTCVLKGR